jgi:hypothetical protein
MFGFHILVSYFKDVRKLMNKKGTEQFGVGTFIPCRVMQANMGSKEVETLILNPN